MPRPDRGEPGRIQVLMAPQDDFEVARIGTQAFGHRRDDPRFQPEQHEERRQDGGQREDQAERHPPFMGEIPPGKNARLLALASPLAPVLPWAATVGMRVHPANRVTATG